jgi:hypothetical protein
MLFCQSVGCCFKYCKQMTWEIESEENGEEKEEKEEEIEEELICI